MEDQSVNASILHRRRSKRIRGGTGREGPGRERGGGGKRGGGKDQVLEGTESSAEGQEIE